MDLLSPTRRKVNILWQNGGFHLEKKFNDKSCKYNKKIKNISRRSFFSVDKSMITNPAKFEIANRFSVKIIIMKIHLVNINVGTIKIKIMNILTKKFQ